MATAKASRTNMPLEYVFTGRSMKSPISANFSIEGIPNSTDPSFTDERRANYIAEARFMRGFNYLFLATLYGDIPLSLKTLNNFEEYDQPKSTQAEVFAAVIDDLTFAKDNLPASWPSSAG